MMRYATHRFEIRVSGWLTDRFTASFDGVTCRALEGGDTLLEGEVRDQSALFGVLHAIEGLGLSVVSVRTFSIDMEAQRDSVPPRG